MFEENGITSLLIDMRLNFGGSPLGLAGHLTDQEIMLGQLSYYSEKTGQFEPDGCLTGLFQVSINSVLTILSCWLISSVIQPVR